ncbi:Nem1-Spo7 phosphatase regulatory subunit [Lecanora helva]
MSSSKLDQIVKGAPPPGTSVDPRSSSIAPPDEVKQDMPAEVTPPIPTPNANPTVNLPSSPPQIYLNLLILEASLRSQYLTLLDRRRLNTFFILILSIWIAGFTYLLFLRPREDGSGVGGSVYWVVEMGEKVALMGGVVTAVLIWLTGQWERGIRWPRRWVGITNRGLRNMNTKIVVIKGPWWKEMLGHLAFLFPYSSFFPAQGSSYHYIDHRSEKPGHRSSSGDIDDLLHEEDLSPGGDYIKLLLLPKPFSPDFRENWELYRLEYWEKENERRAHLRKLVRNRERKLAKQHGGWFWWIGWRRRSRQPDSIGKGDIEKSQHKSLLDKEVKRQSYTRTGSHSRNTSRSSTPSNLEVDDGPKTARTRRGSTTTSGSERRRKAKPSASSESSHVSRLTPVNRPA